MGVVGVESVKGRGGLKGQFHNLLLLIKGPGRGG